MLSCHTDTRGRLVATLGSKSSLKRINRKQILDVDVAKACQTIVDPVAPMALRLQGNLLYVNAHITYMCTTDIRAGMVYHESTCNSVATCFQTRRIRTMPCS
jgi:hypothetical protein